VVEGVDDVGVLEPVTVGRVREITQEADEEERIALLALDLDQSPARLDAFPELGELGAPDERVLNVEVQRRDGLHVRRQGLIRRVDGHPLGLARPRSQRLGGEVYRLVREVDETLELTALGTKPVEVDVGRVSALHQPLGPRDRLVDLVAYLDQERADRLGRHGPPVRLLHAERDLGALDIDASLRRSDAVVGGHARVLDETPGEDGLDDADSAPHERARDVRGVLVVRGGDLVPAGPG
jgi:hypothetical protein